MGAYVAGQSADIHRNVDPPSRLGGRHSPPSVAEGSQASKASRPTGLGATSENYSLPIIKSYRDGTGHIKETALKLPRVGLSVASMQEYEIRVLNAHSLFIVDYENDAFQRRGRAKGIRAGRNIAGRR